MKTRYIPYTDCQDEQTLLDLHPDCLYGVITKKGCLAFYTEQEFSEWEGYGFNSWKIIITNRKGEPCTTQS